MPQRRYIIDSGGAQVAYAGETEGLLKLRFENEGTKTTGWLELDPTWPSGTLRARFVSQFDALAGVEETERFREALGIARPHSLEIAIDEVGIDAKRRIRSAMGSTKVTSGGRMNEVSPLEMKLSKVDITAREVSLKGSVQGDTRLFCAEDGFLSTMTTRGIVTVKFDILARVAPSHEDPQSPA